MDKRAQFYNELLGEPYEPTLGQEALAKRAQLLDRLAAEYHEVCEAYDRTVCTGPIRDGRIMPTAGTKESALINKNSRDVRDRMLRERPGLTRQELQEAIGRHHDRS